MNTTTTLIFFHVLAAITWMGAGITLSLLSIRAQKTGDELRFIRMMEWIGPRIGGPSVLIMLLTGGWMVSRSAAYSFSQLWVIGGLGLLVLLFLIGIGYHVPHYKKIYKAAEEFGDNSIEVKKLANLSFIAAKLEVVLLAVALWLMVVKPTI